MKRMFPVRKNGRFYNSGDRNENKGWFLPAAMLFFETLKKIIIKSDETEQWVVDKIEFSDRCKEPSITWLGHATFLIQIDNINILTDPIFGNLSYIVPRLTRAVVSAKDLPAIDYVLLSHNHPDHMDPRSLLELKKYNPLVKVLTPFGDQEWFDKRGFVDSQELFWWDHVEAKNEVSFDFLPALHWSQKSFFDRNKSLWGSWLINTPNFRIYFGGDTAWSEHFEQIGVSYENIDVALLPIGPGEPKEWMEFAHVNAEEAGEALLKLKARYFIPMHWGTFHLGFDKFKDPLDRLHVWWDTNKERCVDKVLQVLKIGQSVSYAVRQKVVERVRDAIAYKNAGKISI